MSLALQPSVEATDERTALERAAVEQLADLHTSAGGRVHRIAHYNGEVEDSNNEDELREAVGGATPAILVSTGTGRYSNRSNRRERAELTIDLFAVIVADNMTSREDRNLQDSYRLIADVRNRWWGSKIGGIPSLRGLLPSVESHAIQGARMSVWVATYTATFDVAKQPIASSGVHRVETVHTDANHKQGGEITPVAEFESEVES